MKDKITCIVCPMGCEVMVEHKKKRITSIEGHECKSGIQYAKEELFEPKRTLTTTIMVEGGVIPLVSVKTSLPIPKDTMFAAMDLISEMKVAAPIKSGDVLVKGILGLDADVVATKNVRVKGG